MNDFRIQQSILRLLADWKKRKGGEMLKKLSISRPTLYKYLPILIEEWKIVTEWKRPHTTYQIADLDSIPENTQERIVFDHNFTYQEVKILEENFLKYTPDGNILQGVQGFIAWCKKRNSDECRMFDNYLKIYQTLEQLYTPCGVLDATQEFKKHVESMAINTLLYAWQYKWNEFGRSKLAEQGFYAKQTQNRDLLIQVCSEVVLQIECLVKKCQIQALAFTPPSIKRQNQILDVLDELLSHIELPRVTLIKDYPNGITTPQKSLRKRADRMMNAKNTIYVYDKNVSKYTKVLLIDDFVWSGATLNETAKKLRKEWVEEVYGFALVGNLDLSYDVINEM